jgi:hypothetical protein
VRRLASGSGSPESPPAVLATARWERR